MHRDEFRKIVADSVSRSLAQGEGGAPLVSAEQLQSIVNGVADGVFAGLEATLPEDGIPNSINLTQPGAREAVAAAAASAASSAANALLSGNIPPAATVVTPPPATPAATSDPSVYSFGPSATTPAAAPAPYTPPPPATPTTSADASAVAAVIAASSAAGRVPAVGGSEGETMLWQGRPYLTIGTLYQLTTQRLRIIRGIAGQVIEEIELVRVRDTKTTQSMAERLFGVGDIEIFSTDATQPRKFLYNVKDPVEVRELIRKAVVDERARRGLVYREEMHDHDPGYS